MRKKRSQFGFSDKHWVLVKKYLEEFDTAEKRTQDLLKQIHFKGCAYCGTDDVRMNPGGRSAYCASCRVNSYVTAGTFFHGMSRLDVMHPLLYFLEAGIEFSSNQIKTLFDCAYNTAWEGNKRIQKVIAEAMENTVDAIHSCLFEPLYLKRSLETPAKQHPRAEQKQFDASDGNATTAQNEADEADEAVVPPKQASALKAANQKSSMPINESSLFNLIGDDPISVNTVIARQTKSISEVYYELLQLELDGLVERLPGDCYARKQKTKAILPELHISSIQLIETTEDQLLDKVGKIISFLKEVFHGTSRKYLQYFLGTHWFYHDKIFWKKGELFQQCARHERISLEQIKKFVTPANVTCFISS